MHQGRYNPTPMESIKELYQIGTGPSSSHTMGPRRAAELFLNRQPGAASFQVTLFGSLAATGRGHLTDRAISAVFAAKPLQLHWKPDERLPLHPNGMRFEAFSGAGDVLERWEVYSVGGGTLRDGSEQPGTKEIYDLHTMDEILDYCEGRGYALWEYVREREPEDTWPHLRRVWMTMQDAIERGLHTEGVLPGELGLARKAWTF